MRYRRMPIEVESPEELGYDTITNNLSESSVADRKLSDLGLDLDLDELVLCYGDHLGDPLLRQSVAAQGAGIEPEHVIVTPGAATALFAVATSLLDRGDHAVVVRTNYATNLETPRAIGADLDIVDLRFEKGWRLDLDEVADKVQPGTTRLISVTCPHNPTGTMLGLDELKRLVGIAERAEAVLLVDETYRDLTHTGERIPLAATLSPNVVSVSSMSKAYGLPGIRIGWAVTTDPMLGETLLAAKEQIVICGSTIDEHIAGRVLADRKRVLTPIMADVRERLDVVERWMAAQDTFEWVRPSGGVVGLVRFRDGVEVDEAAFHHRLLADHGTYVGPGHWFELSDRYFRLGFGWPTHEELSAGLDALLLAAADAKRSPQALGMSSWPKEGADLVVHQGPVLDGVAAPGCCTNRPPRRHEALAGAAGIGGVVAGGGVDVVWNIAPGCRGLERPVSIPGWWPVDTAASERGDQAASGPPGVGSSTIACRSPPRAGRRADHGDPLRVDPVVAAWERSHRTDSSRRRWRRRPARYRSGRAGASR